MVKEEAKTSNPKDVVAKVSAKVGGVIGAKAPGQLHRGEAQVSMIKQKSKSMMNEGDELYIVMQQAKTGENYSMCVFLKQHPILLLS